MGDAFDTLGLPARFDLDPARIQRAFLQRTAGLHPDHGARPEDEAASASLNAARAVLDDPEQRAGALLSRLGGPSKEQDRSLPDGFLMEMMEVRERIEAERKDPDARERWEDWGESRRRGHMERVKNLFAQATGPEGGPPLPQGPEASVLKAIRRELNAWRYIERMLEQLGEDAGGPA